MRKPGGGGPEGVAQRIVLVENVLEANGDAHWGCDGRKGTRNVGSGRVRITIVVNGREVAIVLFGGKGMEGAKERC